MFTQAMTDAKEITLILGRTRTWTRHLFGVLFFYVLLLKIPVLPIRLIHF